MKTKLAALLEVRKMVTLMFALVFSYLAVFQLISVDYTVSVLMMVFGYYFGKTSTINEKGANQ